MNINNMDGGDKQIYQQLIDLICYTTISARNLAEEPKIYGSLRMVDIAGRLFDILDCKDVESPLPPLFHEHIENTKNSLTEGETSFIKNLDSLVSDAISILVTSEREDN